LPPHWSLEFINEHRVIRARSAQKLIDSSVDLSLLIKASVTWLEANRFFRLKKPYFRNAWSDQAEWRRQDVWGPVVTTALSSSR
jgi:hypothetical protein